MAKNKYVLKSEQTTTIRRPFGARALTTKIYSDGKNKITLYTLPRRPNYVPYGKVEKNNKVIYEGNSSGAETFLKNELNK